MGWFFLLAGWLNAATAFAQGPLTPGTTHIGVISVGGEVDSWTFSGTVGDTIVVRVGESAQVNNFTPRIRIMNPLGVQQVVDSGPVVVGVAITATNTGTFTVMIDGVAANATGTYRVTLLKAPGTVTVGPGDEGGPLTNGVMHTGNIDVGDMDVWTFSANAGESLTLRVGELTAGSSFTPGLWIYGPNGALLDSYASSAVAAEVYVRATNSGTFYVAVADYNVGASYAGTGGYRLTLAKTGSPVTVSPGDEGGSLTNGATYLGLLDVGDLDVWTFNANTGESIFLAMGETAPGSSLTPALWLYGPDGRLITAYGSSAAAAEIYTRATNSGTFTVVAGDNSGAYAGSGVYRLTLAKTGEAIVTTPLDQGGPMTNGVTHTGEIYVGDLDIWNFTASAGESITVRVGELVAGSALTPAIWLLSPNGVLLDSYVASAVAGEVYFRATNSGTFTVVVGDYSSAYTGSGTYRLTLAKTGSPVVISPGDEGGPMVNGVTYTGTIDLGDIDVWTFNANVGDSLFLAAGESVAGSALTPALWLYGPDGRLLDSYGASAVAAELYFRATNSGTFTVVVGDYSSAYGGSGGYRLTFAKTGDPIAVSAGDQGGPLTNGVTHTGEIYVGDLDVWSFSANAGDNIFVAAGETAVGGALTPVLWLCGPDGRLLVSYGSSTVAAVINTRATNGGTFTVVVGDYSNGYGGSGAYRLTLAKTGDPIVVSAGDQGGPLTNGVTHLGDIFVGDLDIWNFTASAGESITIRMGETAAGSSLTPVIWLMSPNGTLLDSYGSSTVAAEVYFRATNSGTFTVIVGDYSNGYGGSGAYRLTLARTGSPIVISTGDEGGTLVNGLMHTGVIDMGDLDVWSFNATAGESIVVRMGEVNAGSALTPALWLYGPDGRLLDSYGSSTVAAEVGFRATNSGTFTVVAGDYSNAYGGTGPYRLTLAKTGSAVEVSSDDEGGRLNGSSTYDGTLAVGDLDVWSFTLCARDVITLRLDELVAGSSLTPWLRLYGRDGVLLRSVSGAGTAQISLTATNSGTFILVAGDFSNAYGGNGAYRLTVNGLSHDMRLCVPRVTGTNMTLSGVGGETGTDFIVLTSPLVEAPLSTWTPLFTNQFDFYGTFSRTNPFALSEPKRFYIIRQGGE